MSSTITIIVRDQAESTSTILDVPADWQIAQLLADILEGGGFDTTDEQNQVLRYYLKRKRNGQVLSPNVTLNQVQMLRGEVLIIYHVTPEDVLFNRNLAANRRRANDAFKNSKKLQLAQRWQAVGAFDRALGLLLQMWVVRQYQTRSDADTSELLGLTNNQLSAYINELFLRFVHNQLAMVDFESFFQVLQTDEAKAFFKENSNHADQCVDALLTVSYVFAETSRYQPAHEAAILAQQLDPNNQQVNKLVHLANSYVTLASSPDLQEQFECAEFIYNQDPHYGNISKDYAHLRQQIADETRKQGY